MKKVIKLTESDLMRIVKRVIKEQEGIQTGTPVVDDQYKLTQIKNDKTKKDTYLRWNDDNPKKAITILKKSGFIDTKDILENNIDISNSYLSQFVKKILELGLDNKKIFSGTINDDKILNDPRFNERPSKGTQTLKDFYDGYIKNQNKDGGASFWKAISIIQSNQLKKV